MAAEPFQIQLKHATTHLKQHDQVLAPIIERSGLPELKPHQNYFEALAGSIIGQQLSVKAAATIRKRFADLGSGFPAPAEVVAIDDEKLRAVGLSAAKTKYVKDLAQHVLDGRLDLQRIAELPNEEIIIEVTDVAGIGEWTAQMFLIFCLGRLDVLPTGDLGVRRGVQILYELDELPDAISIQRIAERNRWQGYESVAAWYIWRSLDLDFAI